LSIAEIGNEYGTTTGRSRRVNYLNMDKLIQALYISGTTDLIISKVDILEKVEIYKFIYQKKIQIFNTIQEMTDAIHNIIRQHDNLVENIILSRSPKEI